MGIPCTMSAKDSYIGLFCGYVYNNVHNWANICAHCGRDYTQCGRDYTQCGRCSTRGGGLGSRPKKMYWEYLGDGVEYHLMSPTPNR